MRYLEGQFSSGVFKLLGYREMVEEKKRTYAMGFRP